MYATLCYVGEVKFLIKGRSAKEIWEEDCCLPASPFRLCVNSISIYELHSKLVEREKMNFVYYHKSRTTWAKKAHFTTALCTDERSLKIGSDEDAVILLCFDRRLLGPQLINRNHCHYFFNHRENSFLRHVLKKRFS